MPDGRPVSRSTSASPLLPRGWRAHGRQPFRSPPVALQRRHTHPSRKKEETQVLNSQMEVEHVPPQWPVYRSIWLDIYNVYHEIEWGFFLDLIGYKDLCSKTKPPTLGFDERV